MTELTLIQAFKACMPKIAFNTLINVLIGNDKVKFDLADQRKDTYNLGSLFTWSYSTQGHSYWSNINVTFNKVRQVKGIKTTSQRIVDIVQEAYEHYLNSMD